MTTSAAQWLRAGGSGAESHLRGTLADVFDEEPVDLDTFVRDGRFLDFPPLSEPQYRLVRFAEQIYRPELYPTITAEFGDYWFPVRMVNELTVEAGKGGGKDLLARVLSLRIAYLLLCLKDPKAHYGMPSTEAIHLLNVASTKDQARLAFFEPLTRMVSRGWFADRCEAHKSQIVWDKGITTLSGSADAEAQEGLNLILGVADEVDAFRTREEYEKATGHSERRPRSVEGIVSMLRTSGASRFPDTFKTVYLSYPRYRGSMIQRLRGRAEADRAARGGDSRHYVAGPLPPWEVNPLLGRSRFVAVPGVEVRVPEAFANEFANDPVEARTKYLCDPPATRRPPFFDSRELVESVCRADRDRIEVTYRRVSGSWQPVCRLASSTRPIPGARYAVHVDLASTRDRVGFALAHVAGYTHLEGLDTSGGTGEWEPYTSLPHVIVDAAIGLESDPDADPPRSVPIRTARLVCFELVKTGFTIETASFDGWQSLSSREELEFAGIRAPLLSIDRTPRPYEDLRDLVVEGRVSLPGSELLTRELTGLVRDPVSRRITHPSGGSKDVADAVAGACVGAVALGGSERPGEATTPDFGVVKAFTDPVGAPGSLEFGVRQESWL